MTENPYSINLCVFHLTLRLEPYPKIADLNTDEFKTSERLKKQIEKEFNTMR